MERDFPQVYGRWPEEARRLFAWAAPLALLALLAVSALATGAAGSAAVMAFDADRMPDAMLDLLPYSPGALSSLAVISATSLIAGVLIWAEVVERRGLNSLGLGARGPLTWTGETVFGLFIGLGLLVLMCAFAAGLDAVAPAFGARIGAGAPETLAADRLADPALWVWLGIFALVLIFNAWAIELLFRGWLLSALAARWGALAAAFVSSALFAAVHLYAPLVAGWSAGLAFVAGAFLLGVFLSFYALLSRSIAGPAMTHGAFSAGQFVLAAIAALQDGAAAPREDVIAEAMRESAGIAAVHYSHGLLAPALFFAGLSAILLWRFLRRAGAPAQRAA